MKKSEMIGQVVLDYSLYSGQDLYSDGFIEEELLNIVKKYSENDFGKVIQDKNEWAILYHLSQVRQNIISWFPFQKNHKVLEIGSGCGAITGAIAERAGKVDCVELSRRRSLINANRNKKHDNITIKVGNFEEIEPNLEEDYDIITLIGVWEYSALYLNSPDPFSDFLCLLKKHLKPDGKIIIAIENKFGLKYWAGCREDHTGMFFEGIEGYTKTNGAVTFGKNELGKIFAENEYHAEFYYPYPDYKLPLRIYSDEHLPETNILNTNEANLDTDRILLFDEKKVFNEMIKEEMFPFFANSFLIVLENKSHAETDRTIHVEYLNERAKCFRIRKEVETNRDGHRLIRICPMHKEAEEHINEIYQMPLKMNKNKKNIYFVPWKQDKNTLIQPYNNRKTILEELNGLYSRGQKEQAGQLVSALINCLNTVEQKPFEETEEFVKIFGPCSEYEGAAVDGQYFNITLNSVIWDNQQLKIKDYEWDFDFLIPVKYIIYRLIKQINNGVLEISEICTLEKEEKTIFENMDRNFKKYICGNGVPFAESAIIKPKYKINDSTLKKSFIKVYNDFGTGFSEENIDTYFYTSSQNISLNVDIRENVKAIRIDPMETSGVVHIEELTCLTKTGKTVPNFEVNGEEVRPGYYLFHTNDPWFSLTVSNDSVDSIHLVMSIEKISLDVLEICRANERIPVSAKKSKWKKLKDKVL